MSDQRHIAAICHHRNVTEATNGREDRRDDRLTHWLCLDCGDRFPLIGDTDKWAPRPSAAPAQRQVKATDGWTPLEFYAYIIRTLGLPASFKFDGGEWVGEGPFTKPVPQSILDLLEAQGV